MPTSLDLGFEPLAPLLTKARQVLLLSDFDGTLVPIQDHPSSCRLPPHLRELLVDLNRLNDVTTGVISGRGIDDLRCVTGLSEIPLAGNHGFEIEGPNFRFRNPTAADRSTALAELVAAIESRLTPFPGAFVEFKSLTATVHLRRAQPDKLSAIIDLVQNCARCTSGFVIRPGRMTLEIRPYVDWDKGKAVEWLRQTTLRAPGESLLIYLGDDATDEDVFAQFPNQVTIKVGADSMTSANYFVPDVQYVHAFLYWASRLLRWRA